jgi:adenylate kinase
VAASVVMMGPPGAGKGTQAERFARAHGVPRSSTGDILRESIRAGTPTGRGAQVVIDSGELVDDETMVGIVRERLDRPDAQAGFVLDGFPRTVPQAEALDALLRERGLGPLVVVDVMVPRDELVRRLAGRRICERCGANAPAGATACGACGGAFVQRPDDERAVVEERLRVYERSTWPLVEFYRGRPAFRTVDGAQPPEAVTAAIEAVIGEVAGAGVGAPAPEKGRERA